jgi:hypothetical protein
VRALAHARAAGAEVLRIFGEDTAPVDIKDVRETLLSLTIRAHQLLNRLQKSIESESPEPHKVFAYERTMDRVKDMLIALENMDQKRKSGPEGPKVVIVDSRMPWDRNDDIIDVLPKEIESD